MGDIAGSIQNPPKHAFSLLFPTFCGVSEGLIHTCHQWTQHCHIRHCHVYIVTQVIITDSFVTRNWRQSYLHMCATQAIFFPRPSSTPSYSFSTLPSIFSHLSYLLEEVGMWCFPALQFLQRLRWATGARLLDSPQNLRRVRLSPASSSKGANVNIEICKFGNSERFKMRSQQGGSCRSLHLLKKHTPTNRGPRPVLGIFGGWEKRTVRSERIGYNEY